MSTGQNGTRAFMWSAGKGMSELGFLPGGFYSQATSVNSQGTVVGVSNGTLGNRAFVWSAATGMVDLNTIVNVKSNMVITSAAAINDKGQILAIGALDVDPTKHEVMDHKSHAGPQAIFLLTPLP